jgi:hypothetical protein
MDELQLAVLERAEAEDGTDVTVEVAIAGEHDVRSVPRRGSGADPALTRWTPRTK